MRDGAVVTAKDRQAHVREQARPARDHDSAFSGCGGEFSCEGKYLPRCSSCGGSACGGDSHTTGGFSETTFAHLRATGDLACRSLITPAARSSLRSFITARLFAGRRLTSITFISGLIR